MSLDYSIAYANLQKIIQEFSPIGELTNEAQTRFSFIDQLLEECLGWPISETRVEAYENEGRTDYELGLPRIFIVEAKAARDGLKFPPKKKQNRVSLQSLIKFNQSTASAILQAQAYGATRGVRPVAVSNGPQLIAFLATRDDGVSPLDGDAIIFDGYDDIATNFSLLYEHLSKPGIEERRLAALLSSNALISLPGKLSAACINYFAYKYSNAFQENLRNAASLIIEDLGRTASLEREFLTQCYCESGPLSQYALIGKNLLSARYGALFPANETGSKISEVNPKKRNDAKFSEQVLQEALARRPIVLVGDVGVGKTSFLKHLVQVSGETNFSQSICINFDLGSKAALSKTPRDALLNQIEITLRDELGINLSSATLIQSIYKRELSDFDDGVNGLLKEVNPAAFLEERLKYIRELMSRRESHLRLCLEHVASTKRRQAVIIIDNADQRSLEVQQEAFLMAQELATSWSALVFLALRPQTFHASKRSGTISAYPTRIFVIPPPKLEDAIHKRLEFALHMAQGRLPVQALEGVTLHIDSLAKLIRALLDSLSRNKELYEFIVNVSGGNVRIAVELVSRYLGSPNVESERIVRIMTDSGNYSVPLHEFAKAALLGDYSHFQEESSAATNVFSVIYRDRREHFLSSLIMGFLSWDGAPRAQADGFISLETLTSEMQDSGFSPEQISSHLQKLSRRKLIETSERRLLETGQEIQEHGLPDYFRITTLGAYHLKRWMSEFSYLEAVSFDTVIFDEKLRSWLLESVNDDRLRARYERAVGFRDYLDETWKDVQSKPYFDWEDNRQMSNSSFARVERTLRDMGLIT
jgi:GTPase SAR1 family protein